MASEEEEDDIDGEYDYDGRDAELEPRPLGVKLATGFVCACVAAAIVGVIYEAVFKWKGEWTHGRTIILSNSSVGSAEENPTTIRFGHIENSQQGYDLYLACRDAACTDGRLTFKKSEIQGGPSGRQ